MEAALSDGRMPINKCGTEEGNLNFHLYENIYYVWHISYVFYIRSKYSNIRNVNSHDLLLKTPFLVHPFPNSLPQR